MSGRDRRPGHGLLPALALALAVSSSACAHLLGGGIGSGGDQVGWDRQLRFLLAEGAHERALERVGPGRGGAGDELLRLQHEGLVAHYAGRWHRSSGALERALALAQDRYTRSASKTLLSLLTSDRVLPYRPPHPERLLLHYYGALNYLRLGQPDEAAVEARRLGRRLQQSMDGDRPPTIPELGHGLSHFSGAVFEAAGQANDADVAYRRARAFAGRIPAPDSAARAAGSAGASAGSPGASAGSAGASAGSTGASAAFGVTGPDSSERPAGEVLLVIERGFVAHKVEQDVTLFLLPHEIRQLREARRAAVEGDGEEDGAEARTALDLARRVAARSFGSPSNSHRHDRTDRHEGEPVLLRISWPIYREAPVVDEASELSVDGHRAEAAPLGKIDLSEAVKGAYRGRRAVDLAKTLTRAVTKLAVAEGVEEAVSEESEALGEVAGWTVRVAGALLERADTRSWHSLPARLELYRLRLPAGRHRLEVSIPRRGSAPKHLVRDAVEVPAGGVRVLTARAWR